MPNTNNKQNKSIHIEDKGKKITYEYRYLVLL